MVVVSPDVNGTKRASALAKMFCCPLAIFSRQRRRVNEEKELDLVGEVEGKICVIVDDIADTAETIVQAASKLKKLGAVAVVAAVVHGVLSNEACERIQESEMELLIITDTIPLEEKVARFDKIRIVSVASLLASSIERIHTSKSLSALFEQVPPARPVLSEGRPTTE